MRNNARSRFLMNGDQLEVVCGWRLYSLEHIFEEWNCGGKFDGHDNDVTNKWCEQSLEYSDSQWLHRDAVAHSHNVTCRFVEMVRQREGAADNVRWKSLNVGSEVFRRCQDVDTFARCLRFVRVFLLRYALCDSTINATTPYTVSSVLLYFGRLGKYLVHGKWEEEAHEKRCQNAYYINVDFWHREA